MVLLLVVGPWLLPEHRDPVTRPLDLPSAALSLVAVLSTVYGMKVWAQDGFGWQVVVAAGGGVALGVVFTRRQRRLADPLIDLRLLRVGAVAVSLATYLAGTLVSFGSYVFVGQYLQLVLGLPPLEAGLWMLPSSGGFIVGSMAAPAIARHVRPAFVMGAGLVLTAGGFVVLTQLDSLGLTALVIGVATTSLGMAPVFTLGTAMIVGAAPPEQAGAAAAISETSSELGGALGIAVLGSIGTAIYRGAMARIEIDGLPEAARLAARDTLGGAAAAAAQLPGHTGDHLLAVARAAFGHALQVAVAICAVVTALTAIMAAVMLRRIQVGGAEGERPPDAGAD
jgi:DHA2 family multidrug resistance protein-like MFS transporter